MKNYSWIENYNIDYSLNKEPEDRSNPARACEAIPLEFPPEFSEKAKEALHYFDGAAYLFYYNFNYVLTDEALQLTTHENGGPMWTGRDLDELEAVLEVFWDDLKENGCL